jgi:WD40 repeat protein
VLPNGQQALSGSSDHTLWLWDLESGEEIQFLWLDVCETETYTERTTPVATGQGPPPLCSAHGMIIWSQHFETRTEIVTGTRIVKHGRVVTAVAVLPDGQRALLGSSVTCCALVPDERRIIVGDDQGSIHVLESIQ